MRLGRLSFADTLDLVESLMFDHATVGYDLDKALAAFDLEAESLLTPADEWGETDAAVRAQDAMMDRFQSAYRPEGLDDE